MTRNRVSYNILFCAKLRNCCGCGFCILNIFFCIFIVSSNYAFAQVSPKQLFPANKHQDEWSSFHIVSNDSLLMKRWLQQEKITFVFNPRNNRWYVHHLSAEQKNNLWRQSFIAFIDKGKRTPAVEKDFPQIDLNTNQISIAQRYYNSIKGNGLVVSIKEDPFDESDVDLKNRIIPVASVLSTTLHATTMASIIAGGGNSSAYSLGVASGTKVVHDSFLNLFPTEITVINTQQVSVQNHSYGVGVENYYGLESQAYDEQVYENPNLVHVFSAGNSGDKNGDGRFNNITFGNLTGQFKTAKNVLVVGGTNAFNKIENKSSKGPAQDGRVKPEITAMGAGGTSEAAALVSGSALLLQDLYKQKFNQLPPASLVKACLLNSAIDRGRPHVDFEYGYGSLNLNESLHIIENEQFFIDELESGEEKSFELMVPPSVKNIKVMLAWTDPPSNLQDSKNLMNDLDLSVIKDNEAYLPWVLDASIDKLNLPAERKNDELNPQEQVSISNPAEGLYQVKIKSNHTGATQPFSLVYTFEYNFVVDAPYSSQVIEAAKPFIIRWRNAANQNVMIQYKKKENTSWITLPNTNETAETSIWNTPTEEGIYELKLSTDTDEIIISDIVICKIPDLKIGYLCNDDAGFVIPEDASYQVLVLDEKYLSPFSLASNTLLNFNANQSVSIQKWIDHKKGLQSVLQTPNSNIHPCYIKNFIADQVYNDSANFRLELGTSLGIQKISLEKKTSNGFQSVVDFTNINSELVELRDLTADAGTQTYRAKVETQLGITVYSREETIEVIDDKTIQVFPNPILKGELLNIILNDENDTNIEVIDFSGRKYTIQTDNGVIKTFDTSSLQVGLYLIRITSKKGLQKTARIIIKDY